MFFRGRTRLTREGYYFVVILALVLVRASMKDINLMLAFAGMMVGAIYFNWFALRIMLRKLTLRRRLPDAVSAGEMAVIELEASSPHRATGIEVEDAFELADSPRREDHGRGLAIFPQLVGRQPARVAYRVRFGRRGRYRFGPIRATSRYPFRLISRTIAFRQPEQLIVLPRLGRLTSRWAGLRRAAEPGTHHVFQRQGLSEGDFYGMRDWRSGDSKRLIHWRTSARRGSLMVRQFEQPRSENLTLLVDLWQPSEPTPAQEENVELAVSFAATVVADTCRRGGCRLRLVVAGREQVAVDGGASRALAADALARLAVAEAAPIARGELFEPFGIERPPTGRLVLISTRPESRAATGAAGAHAAAPRHSGTAARLLHIDAGSDQLFEYFQID